MILSQKTRGLKIAGYILSRILIINFGNLSRDVYVGHQPEEDK